LDAEGGGRRSEHNAMLVEAKCTNVAPSRKPARSKIRSQVRRGKARRAAAGLSVEVDAEAGAMLGLARILQLMGGGEVKANAGWMRTLQ
jgi:hypothetical protein